MKAPGGACACHAHPPRIAHRCLIALSALSVPPCRRCPYVFLGMPRACSQLRPLVVRGPAEAAVVWRLDPVYVPPGPPAIEGVHYVPIRGKLGIRVTLNKTSATLPSGERAAFGGGA